MVFQRKIKSSVQGQATSLAASRPAASRSRARLAAAASAATAVAAAGTMALSVGFAGAASAGTHTARTSHAATRTMALRVGFAGAASAGTHTARTSHAAAGTQSGLPWASGAYPSPASPAGVAAFAAWRGHPLDVVEAWSDRGTWSDIVSPTWLYKQWQGSPYTMAFGVAMLPENVSGVSLQACASGMYNSYWRQFGRVISSYGLGNSIIRLGWEFNGNWYVWQATQPTVWKQCWQQIVTSARSTAPGLRWDWNVNRGVSSGLADPTKAYPGNSYVNMIGVDSYDSWPAATTAAGWQTQLNGTQGLNYWLAFAKAHGKPLSVPEWGNVGASYSSAGGDDPLYVQDMRGFFAANAASVAFEANFQDSASTGGGYAAGTTVPNSAAAYQAGF